MYRRYKIVVLPLLMASLSACQLYMSPHSVVQSVAMPKSIPLDGDPLNVFTSRQRFTFRILVPADMDFATKQAKKERKGLSPLQISYLKVRAAVLDRDRILAKANVDYQLALSNKQNAELLRQDKLAAALIAKEMEPYTKEIEKQRADSRKYAETLSQHFIAENKKRLAEIDRQSKLARETPAATRKEAIAKTEASQTAARERLAAAKQQLTQPSKTNLQLAEQNALLAAESARKQYLEFQRQGQLQRNERIDAPFEDYIKEQDAILNPKKAKQSTAKVQSLSEEPYNLAFLSDGRLQIQALNGHELPKQVELKLNGFDQPLLIPLLDRMAGGDLVISVESDQQKRVAFYGGFSQADGTPDFTRPLLKSGWEGNTQYFYWFEPDGNGRRLLFSQLEHLEEEESVFDALSARPLPVTEWQDYRQLSRSTLAFIPDPYALTTIHF